MVYGVAVFLLCSAMLCFAVMRCAVSAVFCLFCALLKPSVIDYVVLCRYCAVWLDFILWHVVLLLCCDMFRSSIFPIPRHKKIAVQAERKKKRTRTQLKSPLWIRKDRHIRTINASIPPDSCACQLHDDLNIEN